MKTTPKTEPIIKESLSEQGSNVDHPPSHNSKAIFLEQAGAFRDDDSLSQLRDTIYQAKGRSEIDTDQDPLLDFIAQGNHGSLAHNIDENLYGK